jgi:GNAT superfamily N-acetyltransferase
VTVTRHAVVQMAAHGDRYLRLATTLLQRMRLSWPDGGVWEAADVQWWWRTERPTDRHGQLFWLDGRGAPVTRVGLVEPMRTHGAHQRRGIARHILARGLDRLAASGCRRLKVMNDIPLYQRAGFQPVRGTSLLTYTSPSRAIVAGRWQQALNGFSSLPAP